MKTDDSKLAEITQNIIIGLTVSFVALSLGAALGMLSGHGAFAGMISARIIALITATLGGSLKIDSPFFIVQTLCRVTADARIRWADNSLGGKLETINGVCHEA